MNLKKKVFKLLPISIQKEIKFKYYLNKFNNASIHDEKDLIVLKQLIKPGDVVVDIGANYGLYTKFLSEISGPQGKVFSFEPVPETFVVLKNNIENNKLKNVNLLNKAASDLKGEAFISIPSYEDGSENFYQASLENAKKDSGIKIETEKLDNILLNQTDKLNFIKIDVEGHEFHVLKGAEKLIEKFHPKMMIEINDGFDEGSTGWKVKNYLEQFNYSMRYFDGNDIRNTNGQEEGVNFIFL